VGQLLTRGEATPGTGESLLSLLGSEGSATGKRAFLGKLLTGTVEGKGNSPPKKKGSGPLCKREVPSFRRGYYP